MGSLLLIVGILAPLTVTAGPREGFNLGAGFTLSPFVEGSLTYDSNIYLDPEGQETNDLFYGVVGGLSLIKRTEDVLMNLRGWYRIRRYQDNDVLDDDTWQESFNFVWGDIDKLQIKLDQRYSDVSDYEFTQAEIGNEGGEDLTLRLIDGRTRRTQRQLNDIGVSASRQTDKLLAQLGGGYASVSFDDDNLREWEEGEVNVDLGYEATDKSSIVFAGSHGEHDSHNGLRNISFTKLRVGMRSQRTEKLSFAAGVGAELYRAEDSTGDSVELDQELFHYNLNGAWAITRKISLQAFGRNEMVPTSAFDDNTKRVDQFSLGLLWRFSQDWETTFGASLRQDDYSRPIDGVDAEEELRGVQWKIGYVPGDELINIVLNIRYEDFESNIQDEYDQLRASLLVNLTY